jgi:anti-sigma factor RsiW
MIHEESTLPIHAYLDGEHPTNELEVEKRMATDPALAAECEARRGPSAVCRALWLPFRAAIMLPGRSTTAAEDGGRRLSQGQKCSQTSVQYQDRPFSSL